MQKMAFRKAPSYQDTAWLRPLFQTFATKNRHLMIRSIFKAAVLFVSFSACGADVSDDVFSKRILGSWSEGNGLAVFKEGGEYQAFIYEDASRSTVVMEAEGKWWIKSGKLHNTISKVIPATEPVPTTVYIDEIVAIDEHSMTLIDDEGHEYKKYRNDSDK